MLGRLTPVCQQANEMRRQLSAGSQEMWALKQQLAEVVKEKSSKKQGPIKVGHECRATLEIVTIIIIIINSTFNIKFVRVFELSLSQCIHVRHRFA